MKLLEYEAKALLQKADIAIPKSFIAGERPLFLPAVIKSQVPVGGRGKAGGIVIVQNDNEYRTTVDQIRHLDIKGFRPNTILGEELISIDRELYLSILIDKVAAKITIMANTHGGVEVEDNSEESFFRMNAENWKSGGGKNENFNEAGQRLADYFDLPDKTFALQDLVEKLYRCFIANDALLLEINPLILTSDGQFVAGDCKMELDDAAAWRHTDWHFESAKTETNFVTLSPDGEVATVANGAGLAMATVDAVANAGMVAANFLDIGGGASEASILAAFRRLVEYRNIKVIVINIFAGITRCDEVARAIIAARDQINHLPPLAVRLAGTNYEQAVALLNEHNVAIQPSLTSAIQSAKESL